MPIQNRVSIGMTWHITALLVCVGAVIACSLWGIAEARNWRVPLRILLGVSAIFLVAAVSMAFSQMKAATREHYFRTVLLALSHEAAQGNADLVCKTLVSYAHNTEEHNDMRAVVELYRNLMATRYSAKP